MMGDVRRLQACWLLSLSLHLLMLGLYLFLKAQKEESLTIISEVDFIEPEPIPQETPTYPVEPAKPQSVMEFLKMAMPIFKKSAPGIKDLAAPQIKKDLLFEPEKEKLELKTRMTNAAPALALAKTQAPSANLKDILRENSKSQKPNLAQLEEAPIKLEEAGKVAIPKETLAALELKKRDSELLAREQRVQAPSMQPRLTNPLREEPQLDLKSVGAQKKPPALAPLAGSPIALEKRTGIKELPQNAALAPIQKPPPVREVQAQKELLERPKKATEISGPISQRKILKYKLPDYPPWAKEKNIAASVVLQFWVSAQGRVRERIKVARTSGYREFDENAVKALQEWIFESIPSTEEGDQWGYITFNYILE